MNSDDLDLLRTNVASAADAYAKAMRPLEEAREKLRVDWESMAQTRQRMAAAMAPTIQAMETIQKRMAESLAPILARYEEAQAQLAPALNRLAAAFAQLPPRQQKALGALASDGWYLDPELGFARMFDIAEWIETGRRTGPTGGTFRLEGDLDRSTARQAVP